MPGKTVSSKSNAGAVSIRFGSEFGLSGSDDQTFNQNSSGMKGQAENGDQFGASLTVGDFDKDGYADLAIGVPGENLGSLADAGAVAIIYGGSGGLSASGDQLWDQDSPGLKVLQRRTTQLDHHLQRATSTRTATRTSP